MRQTYKSFVSTTDRLVDHQNSLDDRPPKPLLDDLGIFRHRKDDREGQALLARKKTADLLAQSRREHWHRALHDVNARRPLPSIAVKSRVGLDEKRDIRDMYTDVIRAVLVNLDRHSIVEILGVLWVNGEDTLAAEVFADVELALRDAGRPVSDIEDQKPTISDSRPRGGGQTLDHIVAELLRGEVAVLEKRAGLHLDVTNRTEFLNEGSKGMQ